MRSAIRVARSIERHAPHDGAQKKGDDVDLNPHGAIEMEHIGIYVAMLKRAALASFMTNAILEQAISKGNGAQKRTRTSTPRGTGT